MRLRTIMTIVFCLTALTPMLLFWLWPNGDFLRNEKQSVREYHQLLAKSIAEELSSYHGQLGGAFQIFARQFALLEAYEPDPNLLEKLNVVHVCLVNKSNGAVERNLVGTGRKTGCPNSFSEQQMQSFNDSLKATTSNVAITPVMSLADKTNVFLTLYSSGQKLVLGAVSTAYVDSVGMRNRFGDNGHATIVDENGFILSHPNKSEKLDLSALGLERFFERVGKGGNDNISFYSPLFEEEFTGGYSQVENAAWGVLVSQPMSELEAKVNQMKHSTLSALGIGLLVAVALAFIATKMLTFPIVQMVQAMEQIGNGHLRAYENIREGKMQPLEFHKARDSIKAMAVKLRENIDTISQHAYLDGITGLPNRECFKVLAQEEIEKLGIAGQKGALLFLDLDGFKQVNDVYGHRSGDDLLQGFAQKIHVYCGNEMQRRASGAENAMNILPARLGGDEFVIFLGNVKNQEVVSEFAEGLFRRVFGQFTLHNGITLNVNGSVGGAMFPEHGSDFDELLRLADIAMYRAKNSGKGKFCQHQALDEFSVNEASLAYDAEPQSA